ncbi:MAG: hypothetical protein QOE37_8 [Microbacteriaceae bacterium]|jgi:uncharacterized spore protein YtfJ|nr:hypothetical protein [Microbacteriaceae bacterium]
MTNIAVTLAETIKSFGVNAVYGQSQEIEGTTVVPVALVGYGFGGGQDAGEEGGSGGGGGGYTLPIGAYIGDSLGVRFQPNPVALLAVGIPFVWVSGKALALVIKALKK